MDLTHINEEGRAKMVDVSDKEVTSREAIASGKIYMKKETLTRIKDGGMKKGDVLSVAQVAGILGAKATSTIIPMCHNINLTGVNISFTLEEEYIEIVATVKTAGQTGVEMEALTAVSVAGLTIYDMAKAIDKDMILTDIKLLHKKGGKSGEYNRNN